jgi:DNA-binding transcriptional LysR family regulator
LPGIHWSKAMGEFDDLLTFVRVVETGGLSRAADRLGISTSVVSRRLDRLERGLNVKLLHRTTRGVWPTEAGVAFKVRCSRVIADLEEARAEVSGRDGQLSGTLRLAAPVSFGWRHLAPAIASFAAEHERLMLEVAYANRFVDLIGEGFDAAIRIGVPMDSRLVARRLAPIRLALLASPDYLERVGTPRTPADLAGHIAVCGPQAPGSTNVWQFKVDGRWVPCHPGEVRMRADNSEAVLEAAAAGLGLAVLPTFIASDAIKDDRLTVLLRDYPLTEMSLFVLRPPGPATAKIRALTDHLAALLGPEPHWDRCHNAQHLEAAGLPSARDESTATTASRPGKRRSLPASAPLVRPKVPV